MKNTSSEAEYEIMLYLTSKSVDDNQFFVFFTFYTLITLAAGKITVFILRGYKERGIGVLGVRRTSLKTQ